MLYVYSGNLKQDIMGNNMNLEEWNVPINIGVKFQIKLINVA
ncbi:hypothetical protein [Clostridium sp. YIM B02555]|nr:hypothetical protein [Clostridium sp. YIM B02555]